MNGRAKFCGNCGAPLGEGDNFCASCGRPVKKTAFALGSADAGSPEAGSAGGKTGRGNIFEIWRRVFLALGFCGAVVLAFYAPSTPLLAVSPVDFSGEQKKVAVSYFGLVSEEKKRLAGLPLEEFIDEVTRDKIVLVQGQQWATFYNQLTQTLRGTPPDRSWSERTGGYNDRLFFRPGEIPPLNALGMIRQGDELYLKLSEAGQVRYLRVWKVDTGSFFGFSSTRSYVALSVLYPYRRYSPWLALAGLVLYLFLPWPPKRTELISYQRWRIVLTDLVSMILLFVFFSLPFFIIGGTIQAVTEYIFFTLIFWVISALGIWSLKISAWLSGLQYEITPGGLRRITCRGQEDYPFTGMEYVQPVLQVPPRWLVWLTLGLGAASRSLVGLGYGLILFGSECNGFRVVNRDGRTVNIWLNDMRGKSSLPGYEIILEALKNAGIPLKKDVHRFEGMTAY